MHQDIAEVHGTMLATVAAVAALLRVCAASDTLRATFDNLVAHFEAQIRRAAAQLDPPAAAKYQTAFQETVDELRSAIPRH